MNDTTTVTSLNEILGAARTCSVIGTTNPNQVIVQVTMSETANYKPFMQIPLSHNFARINTGLSNYTN